jgi:Tfp pilus assembly protein PilZ
MRANARVEFEIDLELAGQYAVQRGRSVNISLGGVFVDTEPLIPIGTRLELLIHLPGVPDRSRIACIVRWSKWGKGIGLQFERLRAIETWALTKLVRTHAAAPPPEPAEAS